MASPILQPLEAAVTEARTVIGSATVLVNGIPKLIADAVAASIGLGATEAELAPFAALSESLSAEAKVLAAGVVANTPGGPVVPPGELPPPAEEPPVEGGRRR